MNEVKTLVMRGNLVDIIARRTYAATITIENGRIMSITETGPEKADTPYLLPGFIDAHVHIESSMLTPAAFCHATVRHGSIGAVADPHEIANVMGVAGIEFMLNNARGLPFYCWFGVPSCVPATDCETSGAHIDATETEHLLQRDDLHFLAEMMNYPGVLSNDPEVIRKIKAAQTAGKPIDGHYPLATGEPLETYFKAGISTDHETIGLAQGREKCLLGMNVIIREGSAAQNFENLHPLLKEFPSKVMFCTDDIHPQVLDHRHINSIVKKAIGLGYDLYDVLRVASLNPARHYQIPAGVLQEGDSADFIVVNNLSDLTVLSTYIQGYCVFENNQSLMPYPKPEPCNNFRAKPIAIEKLAVKAKSKQMRVIVCENSELITSEEIVPIHTHDGYVESDPKKDILKLVVINRYQASPPSIAFIKGTGLKLGAVAQSIAHDSHNIIAVGATDYELAEAINAVIRSKGGIAVTCMNETTVLPLPVAGLMSDLSPEETSRRYRDIEQKIKALRTPMNSLQMTLAFMGLLVIPSLKLSDKGLFDSKTFNFTSLFV